MPVEVRIPTLGESVTEGVIVRWLKADGDAVNADDALLELETDKANVELPSPGAGTLKQLKKEGDKVQVGEIVAQIDSNGKGAAAPAPAGASKAEPAPTKGSPASPSPASAPPAQPAASAAPAQAAEPDAELSPAVRRLVAEHGLDSTAIKGSGRGGRLTKADVLSHIEQRDSATPAPESPAPDSPEPAQPASPAEAKLAQPATPTATRETKPASTPGADVERVPMTRLRQRIAERLVQAQHTAAILTTFNEVDMTGVMELRARHKERFSQTHGVPLGFMSFFARACVNAIRSVPVVNAQIDGTDIVYHQHVNLGVAVATDRGLVVPIIHSVDTMSFADIEKSIARSAELARDNKLSIEDLSRGTFTISNGGVFGSLLSTPILNPPQSAILGMHKIEKRPVVVNDQIVIRPMMYLAVSYDHRLIDGADAVTFLVRVKENLEDPTRLLLDL